LRCHGYEKIREKENEERNVRDCVRFCFYFVMKECRDDYAIYICVQTHATSWERLVGLSKEDEIIASFMLFKLFLSTTAFVHL